MAGYTYLEEADGLLHQIARDEESDCLTEKDPAAPGVVGQEATAMEKEKTQ